MSEALATLCDLEAIRARINELLDNPFLTFADRDALAARLEEVEVLRAEWDRLHAIERLSLFP